MDNLIFFGGETEYQSTELPWVKDWAKTTKHPDTPCSVITVHKGDKGILLSTHLYKSFVFSREKVHQYLIEALDVWSKEALPTHPLIISVLNQKQVRYGINPDGIQVTWSMESGKYTATSITTKKPIKSKETNPFLPPNNPTTSTKTNKPPKGTETKIEQDDPDTGH